jgi:hypothetical protein
MYRTYITKFQVYSKNLFPEIKMMKFRPKLQNFIQIKENFAKINYF